MSRSPDAGRACGTLTPSAPPCAAGPPLGTLMLGALGVVCGDVGTSPLCTLKTDHGFAVLGAVFLSATGAEALHAGMGHFGARLTTLLLYRVMPEQWAWSRRLALPTAGLLLVVDTAFVLANLVKLLEGGWVPIAAAALVFALVQAWRIGHRAMVQHVERETLPLDLFMEPPDIATALAACNLHETDPTDFFQIPRIRIVELGARVGI